MGDTVRRRQPELRHKPPCGRLGAVLQGVLGTPGGALDLRVQRTGAGAGESLVGQEGRGFLLGAGIPSQSSQLHPGTLLPSLWLCFPTFSLQTAKEEVILSADENPPCVWGPIFHRAPECPFSSLSVNNTECSRLPRGWKRFPQSEVQPCPGLCVLSSGSLSPQHAYNVLTHLLPSDRHPSTHGGCNHLPGPPPLRCLCSLPHIPLLPLIYWVDVGMHPSTPYCHLLWGTVPSVGNVAHPPHT